MAGSSHVNAAAKPVAPDGGDPNILQLPAHSTGLGQPVVTDGYGSPSNYESKVSAAKSPSCLTCAAPTPGAGLMSWLRARMARP